MMIANPSKAPSYAQMLLLGIALMCALVWVAVSYPIPGNQTQIETERLSDRYWLVRHQYHRTLKGMHYGEGTVSESLLDDQSGRLSQLRRFINRGRFQDDNDYKARPLADGRLFWFEQFAPSNVTIFDPSTGQRVSHVIEMENSIVVGNRFLVRSSGHADGQQIDWVDLLAATPRVQQETLLDPHSANNSVPAHPIPGSDCFYQFFDFFRRSGETIPVPIFDPKVLQPQPLPAFANELHWLVLFKQNQTGPKKLAAWPVVGGFQATVDVGKNWISSMSLDGSRIDCRNASTGEIVHQIVVPAVAKLNNLCPSWSVERDTLRFASLTGFTNYAFDLLSGEPIPADGLLNNRILARDGERFLAAEPFDYQLQYPWPPWLQVRKLHSSKPIARFPLPDKDCYFNGDFAGSQIRMISANTRIYCVELPSGNVVRIIDPYLWQRRLGNAIVLGAWVWIFVWIRTCFQKQASLQICYGVITFGSVTFLGLRLAFSGDAWVIERIAWQLLLGIVLAWILATVRVAWRKFLFLMRAEKRIPQFSLSSILIIMVVCEVLIASAGQIRSLYWLPSETWLYVAVWVAVGMATKSLMSIETKSLLVRSLLIIALATIVVLTRAALSGVWLAHPRYWLDDLWYPASSIYAVALTNAIGAYRK